MEKSSTFMKILLVLCFLALLTNVIENFQTNKLLRRPNSETIIQTIMYNFPVEIKQNEKFVNKDNIEFTIKDKNIADKISATVSKVTTGYWGEQYKQTNMYPPKKANNKLVYISTNIKNISNKEQNINDLISAKIIYDNKYQFNCFALMESKDKTDLLSNISLMPLESENIYLVAELPQNLTNTQQALSLELKSGLKKYTMQFK